MNDLECPYCDTEQEACCDLYEPNIPYEHECIECEKVFMYEIEYYPFYTEWEADCLNGGEHDWKDVVSTARIAFDGVKQCRGCGKYNKQPNWKGEHDAMNEMVKGL